MIRDKNWEQIKRDACARTGGFFNQDKPVWVEDDLLLFEAGADAMLTLLREKIKKMGLSDEEIRRVIGKDRKLKTVEDLRVVFNDVAQAQLQKIDRELEEK